MFFNILFFNGSILFLSRPFETVLNKITRGLVKVAILTICIPPTVFFKQIPRGRPSQVEKVG